MSKPEYRMGTGIMLVNESDRVFVGRRFDQIAIGFNMPAMSDIWQMPQGGIDEGEEPIEAAYRELLEEIGTNNATVIAEYQEWLTYDIPTELTKGFWNGRYIGQKQKWFLMRLQGGDELIDINTPHPEFCEWKWEDIDKLESLVIPFKRDVYRKLVVEFTPYLGGG